MWVNCFSDQLILIICQRDQKVRFLISVKKLGLKADSSSIWRTRLCFLFFVVPQEVAAEVWAQLNWKVSNTRYPLIYIYVFHMYSGSSNYASLISRCPLPVLGGLLHSVRSNGGKAGENNKYCPLIILSRAGPLRHTGDGFFTSSAAVRQSGQ